MEALCPASNALAGKYLTFSLRGEVYGLGILKVQEIIGMMRVTQVPRTPAFFRGMINLRGRVIPVIDLRLKFGMEGVADTERTCIIVVQSRTAGQPTTIGLVVDEVSEVNDIAASEIEDTPCFDVNLDTSFILGIGKAGQRVVMLLDIDRIVDSTEPATAAVAEGGLPSN